VAVLVLTAVPAALVVAAQVKQRERDEGPSQEAGGSYSPSDYDFLEKK
jgi:hypothetical protein